MVRVDTKQLLSITEANKLGISALAREAGEGRERVLLRNNKPVAAIVGIDRFEELQTLRDDLTDVSLAAARMLTTGPDRHDLDDILARFGYTRKQLAALPE